MGDWKALYQDVSGRLRWETVDTVGCVRVEDAEDVEQAIARGRALDAELAPSIEAWITEMRRLDEDDRAFARERGEQALEARRRRRQAEREEADEARIARNEALDELYREPEHDTHEGATNE